MQPKGAPKPDVATSPIKRLRQGGLVLGFSAVVVAAVIAPGTQLADPPVAWAVPKPTVSVEGATDRDTAWKWYQTKIPPAYTAMNEALGSWSSAMQAGNTDAMHASCSSIGAAGLKFRSLLPTPDSRATFRIEGIANDLSSAADRCQVLPPGTNWDTAKDMLSYVNSAQARLKSAKMIMQPAG